ncbi:response regulator transcription factor [Dyella sp. BiH032]|uniref:response regulator transcription factor n=1 Tax=Dyella sp. BiH032 TaxID=3075430 RepID=UPI0028936C44|nr:response regulator transcription factor [Dyella sp. BiH032]WNL44341.1 response regulator transcription factor [Dyella sp. BiH032]
MAKRQVAIVTGDAGLRNGAAILKLQAAGFATTGMASAADLYRTWVGQRFDIVLVDVNLPDEHGVSVVRHLRSMSRAGIVLLTGTGPKEGPLDGLHAGADMCLPKPVDAELLSVALIRLAERMDPVPVQPEEAWYLGADDWQLWAPNGRVAPLSFVERLVLRHLADSPDVPVSKEQLLRLLETASREPRTARLDLLIHRLRRKVEQRTGIELPLTYMRGIGYLLDLEKTAPRRTSRP